MRNKETCSTCTKRIEEDHKLVDTLIPDSQCHMRETCCDDASTTDERELILTAWPKTEA